MRLARDAKQEIHDLALCMVSAQAGYTDVKSRTCFQGWEAKGWDLLLRGHRVEVLLAVKSRKLVPRSFTCKVCTQRVSSYA